MKGGPSIAVMLGGSKKGDDEESGEMTLSEAKDRAADAASALVDALESKDSKRIVKAFGALSELCHHIDDLEDSGESDDEEKDESKDEEADDSSEE